MACIVRLDDGSEQPAWASDRGSEQGRCSTETISTEPHSSFDSPSPHGQSDRSPSVASADNSECESFGFPGCRGEHFVEEDDEDADVAYAAFLRDMAGSYDAPASDDEDEDEESGDADEGTGQAMQRISSRRRSSTVAFSLPKDCYARRRSSELSVPVVPLSNLGFGRRRSSEEVKVSEVSARSPSKCSDSSDLSDLFEDTGVRTPTQDNRGPVIDDYCIAQAVQAYAVQRSGDSISQQREDLLEQLRLTRVQVKSLTKPAENQRLALHVRASYIQARSVHLIEVQRLENELLKLDIVATEK